MSEQVVSEKINWISVSESPSPGDYVLLLDHEGNMGLGLWDKKFKQLHTWGHKSSYLGHIVKWTHITFKKDDNILTQCGIIVERKAFWEETPEFAPGEEECDE